MSTRDIREHIVSVLQGIDGLSADGQVLTGKFDAPPTTAAMPFASVYTGQVTEQADKSLRHFRQFGLWLITGFAKADGRTPGAVQGAAEDLADTIRAALRADRTLGGNVLWHTTEATPFEPKDQVRGRMYGVCLVVVKAEWREVR